MTGFGNIALKVFIESPFIDVLGVFMPNTADDTFPYYNCEKLHEAVIKTGIPLYENFKPKKKEAYNLVKTLSPDLIVVSGFNRIIPEDIIAIPKYGVINVHPSLLPKYRGATPTTWVLMNGEEYTGVTIHFIEDGKNIDGGRIITQAKLKIEPYDTDGSLRHKLAEFSGKVLTDALLLISQNDKWAFLPQNEMEATYYPKRSLKDAEIDIQRPFTEIANKIRAMSPYPGAYISYNDMRYKVMSGTLINKKKTIDNKPDIGEIVVNTLEGIVRFQVKREN